ncbi:hypothetical protein BD413DRAFT_237812 [Trametes elegans]|nr:hypothetical protein BD413DRAFT_237812 [Trametes elegans]
MAHVVLPFPPFIHFRFPLWVFHRLVPSRRDVTADVTRHDLLCSPGGSDKSWPHLPRPRALLLGRLQTHPNRSRIRIRFRSFRPPWRRTRPSLPWPLPRAPLPAASLASFSGTSRARPSRPRSSSPSRIRPNPRPCATVARCLQHDHQQKCEYPSVRYRSKDRPAFLARTVTCARPPPPSPWRPSGPGRLR